MTGPRNGSHHLLCLVLLTSGLVLAGGFSAAAGGGELPALRLLPLASGLDAPVAVTHAGDDRLFTTLRSGQIVIFDGQKVRPTPFLDITSRVRSGGERGLLSVAFDPDYASNGLFFVNYTRDHPSASDPDPYQTVIARYEVSSNDPNRADATSELILLTIDQPFGNHNGGQLQFGPDGYLYIGMGDGGSGDDPNCAGQSHDRLLGKMLCIDVDAVPYAVPTDNPFVGVADPPDEVWATGLRNPWRFSFDRVTRDLYIADVGQGSREEVDFQAAASQGGENYGWHIMEGTLCTGNPTAQCSPAPPACNAPVLTNPILEYSHTDGNCSITGGYVYRGSRLPELDGCYLYGDYCSGKIWAAVREHGSWTTEELEVTAPDLTTFGEDAGGELYLATLSGTLYRLVRDGGIPVDFDGDGISDLVLYRDGVWVFF